MDPQFITPEEIARELGVDGGTVRRRLRHLEIEPEITVGRIMLYPLPLLRQLRPYLSRRLYITKHSS